MNLIFLILLFLILTWSFQGTYSCFLSSFISLASFAHFRTCSPKIVPKHASLCGAHASYFLLFWSRARHWWQGVIVGCGGGVGFGEGRMRILHNYDDDVQLEGRRPCSTPSVLHTYLTCLSDPHITTVPWCSLNSITAPEKPARSVPQCVHQPTNRSGRPTARPVKWERASVLYDEALVQKAELSHAGRCALPNYFISLLLHGCTCPSSVHFSLDFRVATWFLHFVFLTYCTSSPICVVLSRFCLQGRQALLCVDLIQAFEGFCAICSIFVWRKGFLVYTWKDKHKVVQSFPIFNQRIIFT